MTLRYWKCLKFFFWPSHASFLLVLYLHIKVSLFCSGKIVTIIVVWGLHIFYQSSLFASYATCTYFLCICYLKKRHGIQNGWIVTVLGDPVLYYQHLTGRNALFALWFLSCSSYNPKHCMIHHWRILIASSRTTFQFLVPQLQLLHFSLYFCFICSPYKPHD